ncbi:MAG: hypothetical protein KF886_06115 [Candidatus Hydrogenedentes bacterium]|nr:hypothetical protein [Candidatus Hydrogenedentota bacterium]
MMVRDGAFFCKLNGGERPFFRVVAGGLRGLIGDPRDPRRQGAVGKCIQGAQSNTFACAGVFIARIVAEITARAQILPTYLF